MGANKINVLSDVPALLLDLTELPVQICSSPSWKIRSVGSEKQAWTLRKRRTGLDAAQMHTRLNFYCFGPVLHLFRCLCEIYWWLAVLRALWTSRVSPLHAHGKGGTYRGWALVGRAACSLPARWYNSSSCVSGGEVFLWCLPAANMTDVAHTVTDWTDSALLSDDEVGLCSSTEVQNDSQPPVLLKRGFCCLGCPSDSVR